MKNLIILIVSVLSINLTTAFAQTDNWFDAIRSGDLETIKSFVEQGIDVNAVDNYGESALMMASRWGHLEIVELLISKGADVIK